jgi:anaerobic magnesium-protoporphyrin IX monomethyl ester cyclase
MKVMLLFPPNWNPAMPHLALPTLTAYLRGHGVEVIQRDLNIEIFDHILSPRYLEQAANHLRRDYGARGKRVPSHKIAAPADHVAWALSNAQRLIGGVDRAKHIMRSNGFFEPDLGRQAIETVADALALASLPYYPAALEISSYHPAFSADSSQNILREVRDPHHNMLRHLFEHLALPDIQRQRPDIVGISVPSMAQLTPALTLAALIKEHKLQCHITIGGPHITMLREQLAQTPALFELIDSAIIFDGEQPLLQLCQAVKEKQNLAEIPNLIYRDGEQIRVNTRQKPEKIGNLPLPDFHGLPLTRYLAPELMLPLLTARGCYYGKCAFCNVGYGEPEQFSLMQSEQLASQMQQLQREYGINTILFADEALTPRTMRDLSRILVRDKVNLHWGGCARFEKPITGELLQGIYQAGCRMLLFGLESASDPIMQRMLKGTQLEHMHRILQQSTQAGIWNHTFFFFGFPGETLDDAQATVNFLYQNKYHIHSAGFGTFLLELDAPAHRWPQSFGITRIIQNPEQDLAIYFPYEAAEGMDSGMAELVANRFLDALPRKNSPQFYINDVYRMLYASYLSRVNLAPPPWLIPEEEQAVYA